MTIEDQSNQGRDENPEASQKENGDHSERNLFDETLKKIEKRAKKYDIDDGVIREMVSSANFVSVNGMGEAIEVLIKGKRVILPDSNGVEFTIDGLRVSKEAQIRFIQKLRGVFGPIRDYLHFVNRVGDIHNKINRDIVVADSADDRIADELL